MAGGRLICVKRSQAFEEENYVEGFCDDDNCDNDYDDDDDFQLSYNGEKKMVGVGISLSQKTASFWRWNDVESFNADNDEEEDGDDGYHDDDYHIMVKRNG